MSHCDPFLLRDALAAPAFSPEESCGMMDDIDLVTDAIQRGRSRAARSMARTALALAVLLALDSAARAAQGPDAGAEPEGEEEVAEDSPRASMSRFVDACRSGQYAEAAGYLDLPRARRADGAELAGRLQAVLDRHAWIDLDRISPLSTGDAGDGLPRGTDEIARIAGPSGAPEPVRLVRRRVDGGGRWLFSRATVNRIDDWYARLEHRWLLEHLPDPLLRTGPRGLAYWQWIALPGLLLLALAAGILLSRFTRRVLARLVTRTATQWDDELIASVGRPLTFGWALLALYLSVPSLGLYQPADEFVHGAVRAGFLVIFFWILVRGIDVARQVIALSPWMSEHATARSLVPLGTRVGKVLLLAIAVVALLSELGYPVASLVAGLGIGGLAVALAAQKSLENLFGAFSLGADQPFREGDFVRVEDFVATVEQIGLRSTRFRTLDRTLITIPNGRLSDMRLESFSVRDRMRLSCIIRLVHGTGAARMREVLSGLDRVLREHPKIWPNPVMVRFIELAESSLNIEVMAWFQTPNWDEFLLIRQDVLLQLIEVVEKAGCTFAFPARRVHLMNEARGDDR